MKRGFTLVELLVVIAIIGILSSVVLASLAGARARGNDARRLSDMHQLQTALELYFTSHNIYPNSNGSGCGGWETTGSDAAGNNFVSGLVADGDMPRGMKDPTPSLEGTCGNYAYYFYTPGYAGCDADRGGFYVFGIRSTDAKGTAPYPGSPGWSCPSRNWQGEFSWVTGGFQK